MAPPWSLPVNRFHGNCRLILERPYTLSAGMLGYGNRHLRHVVLIVGFRQLVADTGPIRVCVAAHFLLRRDVAGIDGDADDVLARWHRHLAVAAVEDKILSTQLPVVNIRPAGADALIARYADRAASREAWLVVDGADVVLETFAVLHAEPAFGGAPHLPGCRTDQLVQRVMLEMEMIVAGREFEQAVSDMLVRVANRKVGIADTGGRKIESHQRVCAGGDTAFLDAAKVGKEGFGSHDPVVP